MARNELVCRRIGESGGICSRRSGRLLEMQDMVTVRDADFEVRQLGFKYYSRHFLAGRLLASFVGFCIYKMRMIITARTMQNGQGVSETVPG